jgi:hypothetical protein
VAQFVGIDRRDFLIVQVGEQPFAHHQPGAVGESTVGEGGGVAIGNQPEAGMLEVFFGTNPANHIGGLGTAPGNFIFACLHFTGMEFIKWESWV